MTTKAAYTAKKGMAAIPAFDFGRFAAASDYGSAVALNPLMANPAAAMVAATAIGFGFTTQVAGAFFCALHGAMAASQQFAAALERQTATEVPLSGANAAQAVGAVVGGTAVNFAPATQKTSVAGARKAKAAAKKFDDLKSISGIGPKLETVLHEMGIRRFADIAGWSDDDIRRIDDTLGFGGRIVRDDWVGQAKALGKARSDRK